MSFSVDDLVSSLNSNHIGQEAIDLAALQVSIYHRIERRRGLTRIFFLPGTTIPDAIS